MKIYVLPLVALASLAINASATSIANECSGPVDVPIASPASCSGEYARTTPPAGAIVVDITGKHEGSFKTVTEAMASISNTTEVTTVFILPGTYHEQVVVDKLKSPLVIQGYTCNTMKYSENQVTITQAKAQADLPVEIKQNRNFLTSTMGFKSESGVKVYNLNVANTAGEIQKDGQAVAVYVDNTDYGFYACNFTGFKSVVGANKGRELYAKSYFHGADNIVFGRHAMAWFESCDIETISKGSITSHGNQNESIKSEYVFSKANVFGSEKNLTMLGTPWGEYARVVFQECKLSDVVNPKGWKASEEVNSTETVYFKEFKNTGPGAKFDQRVEFSGQLDMAKKMTETLGEGISNYWWVDSKFL
ncbi:uncharacterized protein CCR75_009649 [Bremia lactucae]|uniref:pectinesterase n=1 Tax=Bremia lactucae TaxID=4779 RepID=A0A976FH70_BRELC|nr:hypothetical protein CCR75_009649 [Bremia lactucae]